MVKFAYPLPNLMMCSKIVKHNGQIDGPLSTTSGSVLCLGKMSLCACPCELFSNLIQSTCAPLDDVDSVVAAVIACTAQVRLRLCFLSPVAGHVEMTLLDETWF